jgi:hypothetical protein
MRSIHHALLASHRLLPAPLARDLARFFAQEEHVASLASRLLVFARQGAPTDRPPPHFSAECTPPVGDAFAFFRDAVAAWHDNPDAPAVPALFADAVAAAGVKNLLVLLGQRMTPASITDAGAVPPTRAKLLASAGKPHSGADRLTVAGRALAKHAHRSTEAFWGTLTGSTDEKNAAAERILDRIIDDATWWNVFGHFEHGLVYEARVPTGHGARWGQGGEEFIGFLEPFDEALGNQDEEEGR